MPGRVEGSTVTALLLLGAVSPGFAQNTCDAGKLKCVRTKLACLIKVYEASQKKGLPPDVAKLQKCMDKFDGGTDPSRGCFAKLEAKPDATCSTTGNVASIEAQVDQDVDALVAALALTVPTTTATSPGTTTTSTSLPLKGCCPDLLDGSPNNCAGGVSQLDCQGLLVPGQYCGTPSGCYASADPGLAGDCCSLGGLVCMMRPSGQQCPAGISSLPGRICAPDGRCCLPRGAACSTGADCCSNFCRSFTLPPSCS